MSEEYTRKVMIRLTPETYSEVCKLVGSKMMKEGKQLTVSGWIREVVERDLSRERKEPAPIEPTEEP